MKLPNFYDHTHRNTRFGAEVFVLNTGAAIDPEADAMLQALHSRSTGGLRAHLEKLAAKGPEQFMQTYYVGYGDKSIGDCGTVTIFAEGISMLAAKAVQDWPLYSGQEASTRYIDFSKQPFLDPMRTFEGEEIQDTWRAFYLRLQEPVRRHLREQFPRGAEEDEKLYEKAIGARAFDITRAFLPAGATTNIAWHTNLRQAADKLLLLRHHPLPEVAALAEAIEDALIEKLPNSFSKARREAIEKFNREQVGEYAYHHEPSCPEFELSRDTVDVSALVNHKALLRARPRKGELPDWMAELGQLQFRFTLDFGSFRDIQRHRAVIQRMPLLTDSIGFHLWYLEQLPGVWSEEADHVLGRQRRRISALGPRALDRQYFIPMGYLTSCRLTGTLPKLVYLVELRATRFVHPTLQVRARQMADVLQRKFEPFGLVLHLDPDPGRFDIRRGSHDIIEK